MKDKMRLRAHFIYGAPGRAHLLGQLAKNTTPPLSTLRFESHTVFWKRWVTRYSVGKGLKSFFSNLYAFFVDGFQYFHHGRKYFPGHGVGPFQSSFQGIQKRSAPMTWKNR
jgi:hypothetical protein